MKIRSLVVGVLLALGTSGVAGAAGGGYGPSTAVPINVPGGFRQVVVVRTVSKLSEQFRAKINAGLVDVAVLGGTFSAPAQIAVTEANDSAIARNLSGVFALDRPVISAGIVLDNSGRPITSIREIVITLHNPKLKAGDVVAEFRAGMFEKVGVVGRDGVVKVAVRGVTEFVILQRR